MIAFWSSRVPPVEVYLVWPFCIAWAAACLMLSGVSKSGSPAPKSTTSAPAARKASAACMAAKVDEDCIFETLLDWEKGDITGQVFIYFQRVDELLLNLALSQSFL